jgi:Cdc6-like AAA superfamily ATPase
VTGPSASASALAESVEQFIEQLGPVLERIGAAGTDVALEAYKLATAFIDADGLHTDEELWALISVFGPRFDTMLGLAAPADVRKARLVVDRRSYLEEPSTVFELLLGDDHRNGTKHCWTYYEQAMAIGHAVASVDLHPSVAELEAIDSFRTLLLGRMENWAIAKPGTATSTGSPASVPGTKGEGDGEALPPARPIEELLAELDALVGLEGVKSEVKLVTALLQVQRLRQKRGLPIVDSSRHLIFTGNPGTGKTTVARLLAQIYRTLDVVEKGQLVETDRSQLVAGFVGQTAIQTRGVVEKAMGGVLLIDEAYALARGDERDFGQEAIDTLVKLMEDHREDFVVIAAGYPDEMDAFVGSNPGLRSRFPKTIFFPDYTADELAAIFTSMCDKNTYRCTPEASERLRQWLDAQPRDKGFGNARLVRNLFEAAMARQAKRLVTPPAPEEPSHDELITFLPDDIAPLEDMA